MNFSIVIPVFNREDLTRNCLAALLPTLEGAGAGEVIVIDNGSRAETAAVLAGFPWVRVISNEHNRGFAAACNQGARAATGRFLVHLNNDTVPLDRWLACMLARFDEDNVGIVGARLLFPNNTIQHAGVALAPDRLGPSGFGPYHHLWKFPGDLPATLERRDFEVVTGACLVTPRELFLELGGFDEVFWNGYEDVDYCLRVRSRGLRVAYEPSAVLYHYESQSGIQRKRRLMHNVRELGVRWGERIAPDRNRYADQTQRVLREYFTFRRQVSTTAPLPQTTLIVHGQQPHDAVEFMKLLCNGRLRPSEVFWAADGPAPTGSVSVAGALARMAHATELRSDRYVAFIDTRVTLETDWLLELVDTVEYATDIVAATVLPKPDETEWAPLTADAQCTLVKLAAVPQHVRVDSAFETPNSALADWLTRCVALGRSIRRTHRPTAVVGVVPSDRRFIELYNMEIGAAVRPDPRRLEEISGQLRGAATLASIVMLSWNAPEFTEMAVASIRRRTTRPHEIIIIDNGSGPDTLARLAALKDVRIIYNDRNMGFAYGCNQGMAVALGTHVVLLNNDVIVTDGWLEALLDAHSNEAIGISAPRSNYVAGHQVCPDARYDSLDAMEVFADARRTRMRGRTYQTDRVIGFCMCISRAVIDEVGGIDTRYKIGNFEDDDYCLRVRAAGYEIVVCEDSFIHHFGNVTFKANNVDWTSQMQANWSVFAERWSLPAAYPTDGYDAKPAISRGFLRKEHFVSLPAVLLDGALPNVTASTKKQRDYTIAILAAVRDENDWTRVAPVVSNFARAVSAAQSVVFAIAAIGDLDALTLGGRVERLLRKAGIDPQTSPDIDISDVVDAMSWRAQFAAAHCLSIRTTPELADIEPLPERSRSGIARTVQALVAS